VNVIKKIADFLVRYRILLSILIVGAFLIEDINEGVILQNTLDLTNPLSVLALVFIFSGVAIRSWAAGIIRKTKTLAMTGPYALTRHPLYVGSLLLGIGFSFIIWEGENTWVVLGIVALLYVPKIFQEERHLAREFNGEWKKYCEHTTLLYPKRRPQLKSSWSWAQWRYNKEYKTLFTSLVLLALLIGISQHTGAAGS
jgi:protein-S-isoprenylcysteine O-methyltransferase Ste14